MGKGARAFMSTEENKALARRELREIFASDGNLDAAEEIYAPNYVSHQPAGDEDLRGPEAIKQFAAGVREAFPDLEITIEDQIAEGDKVVTRFRTRGTHQGELWGIAPTGKEVELENMSMCRIEGGKMAEEWPAPDRLGMMQQLGVLDQPSG
jgi:predicted ester cyclase